MKRLAYMMALAGMATSVGSCGNDPSGPGGGGGGGGGNAGTATVSLTSPNADDGAVLVTVNGTGLSNVRPPNSSYQVFWRLASANVLKVAVVGDLATGPLFTVDVPDITNLSGYSGTVDEAASRTDALRGSLTGYSISVAGP